MSKRKRTVNVDAIEQTGKEVAKKADEQTTEKKPVLKIVRIQESVHKMAKEKARLNGRTLQFYVEYLIKNDK